MFPMADKGSFLLPGSLDPPILPTPVLNATSSKGRPAWVLLDTAAYIADRKNGTFAGTTTRTNQAVGVSFWLADPPAVSHLCIHCPGMKVTDFLDEPLVVCSGKDIAVIRIAYAHGARPIESVEDMGAIDIDYFVYRVHNGKPSLDVLPNPKPVFFEPNEIGFLPFDGGDFFLSVVRPRRIQLQYDLHIFSSKTNRWTTRLALLEPPSPKHKTEYLLHQTDMVIAVEGGLLGWVDLWRGIMLCDVLDSAPVLRYIQFPRPMDGNVGSYLEGPARAIRDVSCSNGEIKLIEIEESKGLAAAGRVKPCPRDGWTAFSWKTKAHWKKWTKNREAYVDGSSILHVLRQKYPGIPALEAPAVVGPLWSMHDEDVFYLMAKADLNDKNGMVVTVNMMKNTVEDVTSFPAERHFFFKLAYHPFAISKYLNMTLDVCKADSQIQEMKDSRIDPKNTMVLVDGLDPCVTENQLKDILEMFGEVCYLKLHVNERYGIIQFASRSCAEEAIRSLNGAQIGSHSIRLSWRLGSLNKQPTRRRFSERSRASYHPYAGHYGAHYDTAAQVDNPYATLVAAATDRTTCGVTPLLQHQPSGAAATY